MAVLLISGLEALLPWLSTMLVLADRGYCGFPFARSRAILPERAARQQANRRRNAARSSIEADCRAVSRTWEVDFLILRSKTPDLVLRTRPDAGITPCERRRARSWDALSFGPSSREPARGALVCPFVTVVLDEILGLLAARQRLSTSRSFPPQVGTPIVPMFT